MEKTSRWLTVLNVVTPVLIAAALILVFFFTPQERTMGEVQRIFYFHVPTAWVGFLAFLVTAIAGVAYLRTRAPHWDLVGRVSVEIGLVFAVMTVLSGSIWARPAWNTWWKADDPRLMTYTFMVLLYVAYLMLRSGMEDPERRMRFGAVYGIVAFISVPITFFSIRLLSVAVGTLHPVLIGSNSPTAQGGFDMTAPMRVAFFFSLFSFTVLYFCFLGNRLRLERFRERVEQLKAQVLSA